MGEIYETVGNEIRNAGREITRLGNELWNLSFPRRSPAISRLSRELLSEIFLFTLCLHGFGPLDAQSRISAEPLTLCHVSARWRDVAISTPSLWSTIWIDRPREVHLIMTEVWARYSQQCPLTIYLRQTPPAPQGQPPPSFMDAHEYDITETILMCLGNHLERWKRVTFLFFHQTQETLLSLLEFAKSGAPLLEHIHMTTGGWDIKSKQLLERMMYSYPSVKSIVVHKSLSQEFIRWGRLTRLDSHMGCPRDSYLAVLKACSSLRIAELRVTQDHDNTPFKPPRHHICVPELTSLTIHADRVDLVAIFECIVLPKLEGLVLRYSATPRADNDAQALERLLVRSACTLQRFSLRDITPIRDDSRHLGFLLLPHMSSILELFLQVDITDNILTHLTLPSPDHDTPARGLFPKLRMLSLRDLRGDHVDDLLLYRLVVSRFPGPTPDRNGRYSGPLHIVYFRLRVKGHSASPVLPLLVERCRDRIDLRIYLEQCTDLHVKVGWYTSPPIPGGYLTEG
ncbi:hypothetical protein R3P38DRAFT_3048666 [Favolaschia claudopus]|uniref:F-box domain-containing protein n=1 Tax=Favolaschia claudopus TaxID=2862362 RepID=A0AAW0A5L5_9AGAR